MCVLTCYRIVFLDSGHFLNDELIAKEHFAR